MDGILGVVNNSARCAELPRLGFWLRGRVAARVLIARRGFATTLMQALYSCNQ